MKQQLSQIYTNWWVYPLVTPIISGAGRILGEQGFLELGMVTYWIYRTRLPSIKNERKIVLEIAKTSLELVEDISKIQDNEKEH